MTAVATPDRRYRLRGPCIPGYEASAADKRYVAPHEIPLPYPAIEALPEFVTRIDSGDLSHGVRHYNGSLARHGAHLFMAYRVESFRGVSSVGICELHPETFEVLRDRLLAPEVSVVETNIEDPHMASVGGKLYVIVSNVVRTFPPVCKQRVFTVNPATMELAEEVSAPFGSLQGIEKNWTPFELPNGGLGVVYKQGTMHPTHPCSRMVIEVGTAVGWETPGCAVAPKESSLSGRTGPLRLSDGHYLEFVGGHIKSQHRGARYWFGAVVFEAKSPFKVVAFTAEPLVWASEASPTIFNPLPRGGHPVCILPAGAAWDGNGRENVLISCGVNDSYNVILRFNVAEMRRKMSLA